MTLALSSCVVGPSEIAQDAAATATAGATTAAATPATTPGTTPSATAAGTPAPATVRLSANGADSANSSLTSLVGSVNAKSPSLQVDFQPASADFDRQTSSSLAAGSGPDVVAVNWIEFGTWEAQGRFADLTASLKTASADTAGLISVLSGFFSANSQTFGLPLGYSLSVLYVNKALFTAAKQELPSATWTSDQFRAVAQTLDNANVHAGFCPGVSAADWIPWVYANGGRVFDHALDPTACQLDSARATQGLQAYADLWLKHQGASDPLNPPFGTPREAFAAGKVAMVAGPCSWVADLAIRGDVQWDASYLPSGQGGHATVVTVQGLCLTKTAKNQDAAAKIIAAMCVEKDAQAIVAKAGTLMPAYLPAADGAEFDGISGTTTKVFTQALNFGVGPFRTPAWSAIDALWDPALERLWKGDVSAADVAKTLAPQVTSLLTSALATPIPATAGSPSATAGAVAPSQLTPSP